MASDQGTEFKSNASYFKEKYGIVWFWLKGKTKAGLAENRIKAFKSILYRRLRSKKGVEWSLEYRNIVDQINKRRLKALKGHSPREISSPFKDVYSRVILKSQKSRKGRKKRKTFKEKDLVFLETPASVNERGFDLQRGVICKVKEVDRSAEPFMYRLEDLEGQELSRKYYVAELRKAPKLRNIAKQIRHIYESRRRNKRREYLVLFHGSM